MAVEVPVYAVLAVAASVFNNEKTRSKEIYASSSVPYCARTDEGDPVSGQSIFEITRVGVLVKKNLIIVNGKVLRAGTGLVGRERKGDEFREVPILPGDTICFFANYGDIQFSETSKTFFVHLSGMSEAEYNRDLERGDKCWLGRLLQGEFNGQKFLCNSNVRWIPPQNRKKPEQTHFIQNHVVPAPEGWEEKVLLGSEHASQANLLLDELEVGPMPSLEDDEDDIPDPNPTAAEKAAAEKAAAEKAAAEKAAAAQAAKTPAAQAAKTPAAQAAKTPAELLKEKLANLKKR